MNTNPTVSRYADQDTITIQPNTLAKAEEEGSEYKFTRISRGHHACTHGKDTHVIIEKDGKIGCSCPDMTYRCTNNTGCKHIAAFLNLDVPPQTPASGELIRKLMLMGWVGGKDDLHPAELVRSQQSTSTEPEPYEEPDPVLDQAIPEIPEPPNEDFSNSKVSARCQYCKMGATRKDQKSANAWKKDHEASCVKNPANALPEDEDGWKPDGEDGVEMQPSTAVTKTEQETPVVKKDMPTEAEFQAIKVSRLMKSQGSIYKVSGKEVADSAAVSSYAISEGVSTETTVLDQTVEYARATVRAYKGGRYTEGSVLIRRDAILEKLMIDLAEKNPGWIIGWANGLPEFDLNQTVFIGDKRKILGLHIAGVVADKWMFASRDCETKAGRRAQIKILGADWREDDEVESEVEEMKTVAKR